MIICHPRHRSDLCQDPDSISRAFLEQFARVTVSKYYTTMFCPFTVIIHCFYLGATQSPYLTSSIVFHTALCLFDFKPISMSCIEVGSNAYLQSWQTLRKCWNVESSWQHCWKSSSVCPTCPSKGRPEKADFPYSSYSWFAIVRHILGQYN